MRATETIPVVDLSEFTAHSSARARVAERIGTALCDVGFVAVAGHGIDPDLIARAYSYAEWFFTLPTPIKQRYEHLDLNGQRGFTSFGREHAKGADTPDLKEFWHVGRSSYSDSYTGARYMRNLWPDEAPEFKAVFQRLFTVLEACAGRLLEACALFLGLQRSVFSDMVVDGNSILRLAHYPPLASTQGSSGLRAAAHEDVNLITLLCEATQSGLELQRRDGVWVPIHAQAGHMIVDAGDMLQHVTNGILRSTTHRVVNPQDSSLRRLSMPFFVHPRGDVSLTPLPQCVKRSGGDVRFAEVSAAEFLAQRLREIGLTSEDDAS